jgi:hypothetical protein
VNGDRFKVDILPEVEGDGRVERAPPAHSFLSDTVPQVHLPVVHAGDIIGELAQSVAEPRAVDVVIAITIVSIIPEVPPSPVCGTAAVGHFIGYRLHINPNPGAAGQHPRSDCDR